MMIAGTPCPYKGKIGKDALKAWEENPDDVPVGSTTLAENTQMIETKPLPIEETRNVKSDDYSIYESQTKWMRLALIYWSTCAIVLGVSSYALSSRSRWH